MKHYAVFFTRYAKAILILSWLILLIGGAWFYQIQKKAIQIKVAKDLNAIVQLKVDQIVKWRQERLDDATLLSESPFFIKDLIPFLTDPNTMISQELSSHFRSLQKHYADILVMDAQGQIILGMVGEIRRQGGYPEALTIAMRERAPAFVDLSAETPDSKPHIDLVVPFFSDSGVNQRFLGAVILVIHASDYLYPLIQSWPISSKTSETLLVRRDGDDVIFLNELRHRKDTALKLRIPVSRSNLPASMAVTGKVDVVKGLDYRDVSVIAALLPIPDSPWFMVAKEDESEIFAQWRFQSILILGLLLGFSALIGAVGLLAVQRDKKAHYRELFFHESTLRANEERYRITLNSIGDAVITTNAQGVVEMLNPVAETLTGWTNTEAHGKPLETIFHIVNEETRKKVDDPVEKVLREGTVVGLANHTLLIARNGMILPIADSGAPIRDENNKITGVVMVFRDQTEERWTARQSQFRSELMEYAVTHTLKELITRAIDEIASLVDSPIGFYHFVDSEHSSFTVQHWSTRTLEDFCRDNGKKMNHSIRQAGIWANCIQRKEPVVHNDFTSTKHERGMPQGHVQILRELVIPVLRNNRVVAILGVGNKPTAYSDSDMESVSILADMAWEIFSHKKIEDDWHDSEKRYRRLFESALDGILILNAETGRVVDVNPFLCQLLGVSHDELLGRFLWDIGTFKNVVASKDAFTTLKENGYIRYENLPMETADGRIVDVEVISNIYLVDHTRVIQCNVRDITIRKQTERALKENREKYQTMVDNISIGVALIGPDMNIIEMNRQMREWFPAVDPATGPICYRAFNEPSRETICDYCPTIKTLQDGGVHEATTATPYKTGIRNFKVVSSPVRNALGQVTGAIELVEDITANLRLTAQLQQAQKMESVGRLAGGVAHDYNNMLSVILGYTELAMEKVNSSDPLYSDLNEIYIAAKRSSESTRQLLAFARKQTIKPEVIDVNETVEGMLKMLHRLIGEDIELIWLPQNHLWHIKIDPSQLEQILANLCVNARDAISGVGKITIETHTMLFDESYCSDHAGFTPGEFVQLVVSDDGIGMDKETEACIFEPFFTTKEVNQGTGLGLATVYGAVKQNGGFINVYSELGKGSSFKIYLRRHLGDAEPTRAENDEETPIARGEMVLIVEDELPVRKISRRMLERLGYRVLTASTPEEALRLAAENEGEIQLLLTDVVMPGMNGRELADRLHDLYPEIKILFMSGYTTDVIANKGVLQESVQFIQKPFSINDLGVKIRAVLDNS